MNPAYGNYPVVVDIRLDPPAPAAGQAFRIIVSLDRPVERAPLTLGWEKQRVIFIARGGQFPQLRPTGAGYFDLAPDSITIEPGKSEGETQASILKQAIDNDSGNPVPFPDHLALTYFVQRPGGPPGGDAPSDANAYRIRVFRIERP